MRSTIMWRALERASPALFVSSGMLLLVQVILIGLRRYEVVHLSDQWTAVPSIPGVIAGLIALIGLCPQLSQKAPTLARFAAAAAASAGMLLCTAAAWLIGSSMRGGLPQPLPVWFLGVAAAFIVAFIFGFILSGAASFRAGRRVNAGLLLVPALAWGSILVVGMMTNMSDALRLDYYTNGAIGCAFIALGLGSGKRLRSDAARRHSLGRASISK